MDVEQLQTWKIRVSQLNDGTGLAEWKAVFQGFADLYKAEFQETLSGGALTTALGNLQTAANTFIAAMTTDPSNIKK